MTTVSAMCLVAVAMACGVIVGGAAAASSFPCCANQVTNEAYDSCTCLEDNTWLSSQVLGAGSKRYYHWRLTDWNLINVPDNQRPDITFAVHPCTGSANLYITPMQPPFPDSGTYRWKSDNEAALNSITTKLQYSEYLITVEATATADYSIVAIVDSTLPVVAGGSGVVTALPIQDDETIVYEGDTMSMLVQFQSSSRAGAMYRVYAAEAGTGTGACQSGASTVGACILTTPCGLEKGAMVAKSSWTAQPANSKVLVTVDGLKQDQPYVFNVAAKSGDWQTSYVATRGTPTYKRETRSQDDSTVLVIVLAATAMFVLLVILILWARARLQKAYHQQHYSKTANRFRGL